MSLLNDALRNAEQRQKGSGPAAPGVYTGTTVRSSQRSRWPLLLALFVLGLVLAGAGAWYWQGRGSPVPVVTQKEVAGKVQRDSAEPEVVAVQPPASEPVSEPVAAPQPPSEPEQSKPQPQLAKPERASEGAEKEANTAEEPARKGPPEPVKLAGQSPEARDREASRQIRDWLADGRAAQAMDRLKQITVEQSAPQSRRVMARHLLASNRAAASLEWLPVSAVSDDSHLRLLRARALLAVGEPEQALGTLEVRVPPIEEHAAYRVTLATLLQRQERFSEAANHWGALIAWDDSHAPWWAGLAMTLEAQGNRVAAVRAYRQAASLPGLSPELADYVRQRLHALQAG